MANTTGALPIQVAAQLDITKIQPNSPQAFTAAFVLGVLLHVGAFSRGEWDLQTTNFITGFFLAFVGLAGALAYLPLLANGGSGGAVPMPPVSGFLSAFKTSGLIVGSLIVGIYTSILVYRALFHRLNRFPGPFMARLSNFYITSRAMKRIHLYEEIQQLHEQYGDIVRIGPSELSINDVRAVAAIHANSSPCTKGPWYNVLDPMVSLHMVRDSKAHAVRRRAWDKGFSAKSLRDYEPRVSSYTAQLLERIEQAATSGATLDMTDWFNYYSFDVMGDLAFGKSFGMLANGVKHYFMTSLHADMGAIGMFSHLIWLFPIFKQTPILNAESKRFWRFVTGQVDERMRNKPDRPDVFSWVLADYEAQPVKTAQMKKDLYGDAYLIIVAGSDTTAASLACLFFELARSPQARRTLQAEIDQYYASQDRPEHVALSKLKYLQACIDEALRLHPPVPSGVQRFTPAAGLQIGETFIPGNTIVQIPSHTMYRDPRLYPRPDEFIPERWSTQPELALEPSTFAPFSTGKYSCAGKQLGLMEVRYVAAEIVRKYEFRLAPDQTEQGFLDGKQDAFTLALGPLKMVFSHRK